MLSEKRAAEILRAARGRRLLVVGDFMLDRYVWGDAWRISPEAPVPVVAARGETHRLGGAGNVASNLVALEAVAVPVGVTGDDASGGVLRDLLNARSISLAGLCKLADRPTTLKTRVIARNQQVVRYDIEFAREIDSATVARLQETIGDALAAVDGVIVSDYGKGVVTQDLLAFLLEESARRRLPVAVDPKETHFFAYRNVAVITPNSLEAGTALGRRIATDADVEAAGREIRERLQAESILITRGERGMTLVEEGRCTHLSALAEEVYDVTGAGDTVVSVFGLARASGASSREAAALANVAASLVVREVGTATPTGSGILSVMGARGYGARTGDAGGE